MPKRDPVTLDNDSGRILPIKEHSPKPAPRRAKESFRIYVETEIREFAQDVAAELVDTVKSEVAEAFRVDDFLMRRR